MGWNFSNENIAITEYISNMIKDKEFKQNWSFCLKLLEAIWR